MKIYTLMENTPYNDDFLYEHGLSLYIETENHRILFDSGQTDGFAENAEKLGIDLENADMMILSHGHYDHGGGLRRFLKINKTAPVYLSRYAFEPHFSGKSKYIGLDTSLAKCDRLVYIDEGLKIDSGLEILSCNHMNRTFGTDSFGLYTATDGEYVPDDFRHELYLTISESGRDVLFSGCSHKGVLNISHWFKPDVLIGGFHFKKLDVDDGRGRETLDMSADELLNFNTVYYTCHCTGTEQYRYLKGRMGDKLSYLSSGQVIEI